MSTSTTIDKTITEAAAVEDCRMPLRSFLKTGQVTTASTAAIRMAVRNGSSTR